MYNTNIPTQVELPTTRQLVRSTVIAAAAAGAILVTIVLPAEYGVDPTGAGSALGLTEMGEIKTQLAEEAAADAARDAAQPAPAASPTAPVVPEQRSSLIGRLFAELLVGNAHAQEARSDEITITLAKGQGAEVKLEMKEGAEATFSWSVQSGAVNFDTHGDGGSRNISYEKGRGVSSDEGTLKAAFDGNHGWFWRNRGNEPVKLTLRTSGAYAAMKRVM